MRDDRKRLLRNFILEMLLYGLLLIAYFLAVLRVIGDWLTSIHQNNHITYAIVALALIVAQGFGLEIVTSYLMKWLGLDRNA